MIQKSTDREAFYKSKPVLVFNGSHTLVSLVCSVRSASQLTGVRAQAISFACNGKQVSAGNYFFRHLHSHIEVESSDYGSLKLKEYDNLCQIEKPMHTPQAMLRRRNYAKVSKDNKLRLSTH